jgi:hypothetical protein
VVPYVRGNYTRTSLRILNQRTQCAVHKFGRLA